MASITKNKLTVVVVVAILAIMLLPSMIDSSSVTNSTTNATTNNTTIQSTTIQSTTITTAITANTCSTSSYAYGISSSGTLSCSQVQYSQLLNSPSSASFSPTFGLTTTSTSGVMAGYGNVTTYTPTVTGDLLVLFFTRFYSSGLYTNNEQLKYGTGSAPAQNASPTGSNACNTYLGYSSASGQWIAVSIQCLITNLTINTKYWFDIEVWVNGGTSVTDVTGITILEI